MSEPDEGDVAVAEPIVTTKTAPKLVFYSYARSTYWYLSCSYFFVGRNFSSSKQL